jgi:threonyl-tRNA synthetase
MRRGTETRRAGAGLKTVRRSTAHLAAQAEHHMQKARLIELRVREQEGRTVDVEYHNKITDEAIGFVIMEMSNLPGIIGGRDLELWWRVE